MIENLEGEIWKDVPNCDGIYEISNFGKLKSWKRGLENPKILKSQTDSEGYKLYTFNHKGFHKVWKIHRLVLFLFNYRKDYEKLTVNHKDFNKANNHVDNLEWCTNSKNYEHYYQSNNYIKGSLSKRAKLIEKDVLEIRLLLEQGKTNKELAEIYKVSPAAIYLIFKRENWKHI